MGDSTFLSSFCPGFFFIGGFQRSSRSRRGERSLYRQGFWGVGHHTQTISRLLAPFAYKLLGRERAREGQAFGGAGTHVPHDKTSRVERSHDNRASTSNEDGFCLPPGTGLAWRAGQQRRLMMATGPYDPRLGRGGIPRGAPLISHTSSPLIFNLITMYIQGGLGGRTSRHPLRSGGWRCGVCSWPVGTGRDGGQMMGELGAGGRAPCHWVYYHVSSLFWSRYGMLLWRWHWRREEE